MSRVYLDPKIFVIPNFVSAEEADLLLALDSATQAALKTRVSELFDNTYTITGSCHVRTTLVGGMVAPHSDQHDPACECGWCVVHRGEYTVKYACAAGVYLNDGYSGGEVHYPLVDVTYSPKLGDLLVHPASSDYVHEVSKVGIKDKKMILLFARDDSN